MSPSNDLQIIKKLFQEEGVDSGCATEFYAKDEKEFELNKSSIIKKHPNCKFFVKEENNLIHVICLNVRFDDQKANKLVQNFSNSINETNSTLLNKSSFDPSKFKFNMFGD
ncbi:MAG: hypothetical protein ACK4IX_06450 [Candidatus Sericytochromatia bacterium]